MFLLRAHLFVLRLRFERGQHGLRGLALADRVSPENSSRHAAQCLSCLDCEAVVRGEVW
jgi:hypothetical protein